MSHSSPDSPTSGHRRAVPGRGDHGVPSLSTGRLRSELVARVLDTSLRVTDGEGLDPPPGLMDGLALTLCLLDTTGVAPDTRWGPMLVLSIRNAKECDRFSLFHCRTGIPAPAPASLGRPPRAHLRRAAAALSRLWRRTEDPRVPHRSARRLRHPPPSPTSPRPSRPPADHLRAISSPVTSPRFVIHPL
jgi:hypothetical protein